VICWVLWISASRISVKCNNNNNNNRNFLIYFYYHPYLISVFSLQAVILYLSLKVFCMFPISQFYLSLSQSLTNPRFHSPHTVRTADGLLCISCVEIGKYQLITFTYIYAYCQHPMMYHHIKTTKLITTHQLFRFGLAEICWCVLKTTVVLF
jgi:hypothetical protein